jgi:antitoxin HicB
MKLKVQIQQDEDDMFVIEVPFLPGCISQGTTRDQAIENCKEAIQLYLESLKAHGDPSPPIAA